MCHTQIQTECQQCNSVQIILLSLSAWIWKKAKTGEIASSLNNDVNDKHHRVVYT